MSAGGGSLRGIVQAFGEPPKEFIEWGYPCMKHKVPSDDPLNKGGHWDYTFDKCGTTARAGLGGGDSMAGSDVPPDFEAKPDYLWMPKRTVNCNNFLTAEQNPTDEEPEDTDTAKTLRMNLDIYKAINEEKKDSKGQIIKNAGTWPVDFDKYDHSLIGQTLKKRQFKTDYLRTVTRVRDKFHAAKLCQDDKDCGYFDFDISSNEARLCKGEKVVDLEHPDNPFGGDRSELRKKPSYFFKDFLPNVQVSAPVSARRFGWQFSVSNAKDHIMGIKPYKLKKNLGLIRGKADIEKVKQDMYSSIDNTSLDLSQRPTHFWSHTTGSQNLNGANEDIATTLCSQEPATVPEEGAFTVIPTKVA